MLNRQGLYSLAGAEISYLRSGYMHVVLHVASTELYCLYTVYILYTVLCCTAYGGAPPIPVYLLATIREHMSLIPKSCIQ